MNQYFAIFNPMVGETIAVITMDQNLLMDKRIVDPESLTLKPIENGSMYTLLPLENPCLALLRDVRRAHRELSEKPGISFGVMLERTEGLVAAIGRMFMKKEVILVKEPLDMAAIINPKLDHEPQKVQVSIIDDLAKGLVEEGQDIMTILDAD